MFDAEAHSMVFESGNIALISEELKDQLDKFGERDTKEIIEILLRVYVCSPLEERASKKLQGRALLKRLQFILNQEVTSDEFKTLVKKTARRLYDVEPNTYVRQSQVIL